MRGDAGRANQTIYSHGVILERAQVNAGVGTILIEGRTIGSINNQHGVVFYQNASNIVTLVARGGNSLSPAIRVYGESAGASLAAINGGFNGGNVENQLNMIAAGEGGIQIEGRSLGTAANAIDMDAMSLLSATADVEIRTNAGKRAYMGNNNGAGEVVLGSCQASTTEFTFGSNCFNQSGLDASLRVTTSSADIKYFVDSLFYPDENNQTINTTGDISVKPVTLTGFTDYVYMDGRARGFGTLTIGNNTANNSISTNKYRQMIVQGEFWGQGPHQISGGSVELYGSLVARVVDAPITVRAASWIWGYERNTSHGLANIPYSGIQTNMGDIVLWANEGTFNDGLVYIADRYNLNSDNGYNPRFANVAASQNRTGGGDIIIAGGEDTNTDGRPDGAVLRNQGASHCGIRIGSSNGENTFYSGGGDITIKGKTNNANMTGVCIVGGYYGTNLSNVYAGDSSGKVIASGRGRIIIEGEGLATNSIGLALGENTYGGVSIRSGYNATATESAIVLLGKTVSTWPALRFGFYAHDHYGHDSLIQATGTGGISLIGDNPASASWYSIEFTMRAMWEPC